MYADGMLGNKAIYDALTPITTGIFNYIRSADTAATNPDKIFPWIVEYSKNPDFELTEQDKASSALLNYMTQAQGFSMEKINVSRVQN
jgi:hypothetical protein